MAVDLNKSTPRPCAKWTPDCQGKWDYDGRLISISCRYWPRGGGSMVFANGQEQLLDRLIKPSATASILLNHSEPDECGYGESRELATADFEAETEAEVKTQVEAWVACQFQGVVQAVNDHDRLKWIEKLAGELANRIITEPHVTIKDGRYSVATVTLGTENRARELLAEIAKGVV